MDRFVFEPASYGPVFAPLLDAERLIALGPGSPVREMRARLESVDLEAAFKPQTIRDRSMARACLAGLWLLYDFLDESHSISQEIETPTGSYWHGIMHRREPDYGNSAYWFRRVGRHPIFGTLCGEAARLAEYHPPDTATTFLTKQSSWDPFAFIDLCEAVASGKSDSESLCQQVQRVEWQLLFGYCHRSTIG
jgi:hypothetical protein